MIEYCPALMLSVGRDSQPCHQQKMDHPLALPSQFCPNLMDSAANLPEKAEHGGTGVEPHQGKSRRWEIYRFNGIEGLSWWSCG